MLFEVLPTELLLDVLGHVEHWWWSKDVAQLVLVSQAFNRVFTPILYRTVILTSSKSLRDFHSLVESNSSRTLIDLAYFLFYGARVRQLRERHANLLQHVHNLSISYATDDAVHMNLAREIIGACPSLDSLQVTPAMSPRLVLSSPVPTKQLWIADNTHDLPFLLQRRIPFLGEQLRLPELTHLARWLAMYKHKSAAMDPRIFPNLRVFSSTCGRNAEAVDIADAVKIILELPTVRRVVLRIECAMPAEVTKTRVWEALQALEDSRIFALGVAAPSPLIAGLLEVGLWRRNVTGSGECWSAGEPVCS